MSVKFTYVDETAQKPSEKSSMLGDFVSMLFLFLLNIFLNQLQYVWYTTVCFCFDVNFKIIVKCTFITCFSTLIYFV